MTIDSEADSPVFFFDCDNCLYSKDLGVLQLMRQKIVEYFVRMGMEENEAKELRARYHMDYGLALRGLQKHHEVDPIQYDKEVDGSLPLDDIMKPDPELREMLTGLKMKKWIFTNAYYPHAWRCVKLLGIDDQFDGMTFADYRVPDFVCKPEIEAYKKAMEEAGVKDPSLCYLVDDSAANVDAAKSLGWTSIHVTDDLDGPKHGDYQITTIHDLAKVLPHLWK
ncbi:pyrimidine 5'-nucleotidase [Lichtheimia ornata]|uniref:Pyrimidine 5'-nucleotidase n=1 Tax=Lichtheimia ornata TaxID=688661 RepID=A0AAD7UYI0_9FUNG|nr:pyrimidine 5'-nucleotidase [Lichtheimia ornata]KAJ8655276.1 pyrimidine 5'-nucleotidase [Lichtheimia ornata]